MTKLVQAFVPAELRDAAEAAVAPFLVSPGEVWTVPLTSDGVTITHYGLNAPVDSNGELFAGLASLAANFPGSGYQVTLPSEYSHSIHWTDWLESNGLELYREPEPSALDDTASQ